MLRTQRGTLTSLRDFQKPEVTHIKEQKEACPNVNKQKKEIWMHDLSLILTVLHHMRLNVQFVK